MSAAAHKLTLEEFRPAYVDWKTHYELRDSEVVQKSLGSGLCNRRFGKSEKENYTFKSKRVRLTLAEVFLHLDVEL